MTSTTSKLSHHEPGFRGTLVQDAWAMVGGPEHATIKSRSIAEVYRAASAITTLAALLRNSLSESGETEGDPLGLGAHLGLLDALHIVGDHLYGVGEQMHETADHFRAYERTGTISTPDGRRTA